MAERSYFSSTASDHSRLTETLSFEHSDLCGTYSTFTYIWGRVLLVVRAKGYIASIRVLKMTWAV